MLFKVVKEYSKRQRINLNKDDGLTSGDKVVILTDDEYQKIKNDIIELEQKAISYKEVNDLLGSQENDLKKIVEDVTAPIDERYNKELDKKDKEITDLKNELNTLKGVCNQYNIDMSGLSLIDVLFRSKHKKLVSEFNNKIWFKNKDGAIDGDVKLIDDK